MSKMLESFMEISGIWGQRLGHYFTKQGVGPLRSTMAYERYGDKRMEAVVPTGKKKKKKEG